MIPAKKKAVINQFRSTREERKQMLAAAAASGKSLSRWLREIAIAAVEARLKNVG
jgi:uncharacterized protein (DUF1778 family)